MGARTIVVVEPGSASKRALADELGATGGRKGANLVAELPRYWGSVDYALRGQAACRHWRRSHSTRYAREAAV